jgi:hypothetical protein
MQREPIRNDAADAIVGHRFGGSCRFFDEVELVTAESRLLLGPYGIGAAVAAV